MSEKPDERLEKAKLTIKIYLMRPLDLLSPDEKNELTEACSIAIRSMGTREFLIFMKYSVAEFVLPALDT